MTKTIRRYINRKLEASKGTLVLISLGETERLQAIFYEELYMVFLTWSAQSRFSSHLPAS
jgi:hypothetical protein